MVFLFYIFLLVLRTLDPLSIQLDPCWLVLASLACWLFSYKRRIASNFVR